MKIKKTIVSLGITDYSLNKKIVDSYKMRAGDLAVFEIVEIGKHDTIQMQEGKNHGIFPGDRILAAFGDRYATSQFEGYVPDGPCERYHILGGGGIIGVVKSKNYVLKDIEPTTVKLIGYCCDNNAVPGGRQGEVINTKFYNKNRISFTGKIKPKVILSVGSTMDSGKTTTAAFISRGLAMAEYKVGYIKLTGTAYTKDREFVLDCGAEVAADFCDVGYPSTYMCSKEEILDIYQTLIATMEKDNPEFIVMEIADGLMQRETNFLLKDKKFMSTISKVIFSCGDSLSAFHGVQLLRDWGVDVTAISGRFTMSPLLIQEVFENINIPVFSIEEVMTGMYNHLFDAKSGNVSLLEKITLNESEG